MAKNIFTTKQHRDYITLFFMGQFICNCDSWDEIEEEKLNLLS